MQAVIWVKMNAQLVRESSFLTKQVQKCLFPWIGNMWVWQLGRADEKLLQKCYMLQESSAYVEPQVSEQSSLTYLHI